jgi:hypothetical protein
MVQLFDIGNSVRFTGPDGEKEDQRPDASVDPTVNSKKKKSRGKKGMYKHYVDKFLLIRVLDLGLCDVNRASDSL